MKSYAHLPKQCAKVPKKSGAGTPAHHPAKPPVKPPVHPPMHPPVKPPVHPPVHPPVKPPVHPPVKPPVSPPKKPAHPASSHIVAPPGYKKPPLPKPRAKPAPTATKPHIEVLKRLEQLGSLAGSALAVLGVGSYAWPYIQQLVPDAQLQPDDSIVFPDQSVLSPDGVVEYPDGGLLYPDGLFVFKDGTQVQGKIMADGEVVFPDATA